VQCKNKDKKTWKNFRWCE